MKFYVASRFSNKEEVRDLFKKLKELGHEITADWTLHKPLKPYEENPKISREYAVEDINGVREADVFVILNANGGTGVHTELGVAIQSRLEKGKPEIYVIGKHNTNSLMYFHPTVVLLNNVDELLEKIQNRIRKGVYKHYKGKLYEVLGVGHHSETLEELVFYHAVGENRLWVRLKKMFFEMIEVNGKKVSRFNFIANKL